MEENCVGSCSWVSVVELRRSVYCLRWFRCQYLQGWNAVRFVFRQRTEVKPAWVWALTVVFPSEGYIKNTEKLDYGKEHQYKLTVTAHDCGKKRAAEDVLVKISIRPTCTPGWQGEPLSHLSAHPCSLRLYGTETCVFPPLLPLTCGPT